MGASVVLSTKRKEVKIEEKPRRKSPHELPPNPTARPPSSAQSQERSRRAKHPKPPDVGHKEGLAARFTRSVTEKVRTGRGRREGGAGQEAGETRTG